MKYEELVDIICRMTDVHEEAVREVLHHIPDALLFLKEGDHVRTPLGVFKATHRRGRFVKLPGQDRQAKIPDEIVVKLRPGVRLKKGPRR